MVRRSQAAYDRFKRSAEVPMLALSLAFVPVIVVPAVADLSERTEQALVVSAWLIWAAFVVEYLTLLYLAPDRWHTVRTHLFDLAIIVLPFLRPLRAARALRVVAGFGRGLVAVRTITGRRGFRSFIGLVVVLVPIGGLLTYAFERNHPDGTFSNAGEALWWAVVTSTTVGYGDYAPVSSEGRAVAVVLMLVGIGLLSVVTANVAAFFVETGDERSGSGLTEMQARLERIEQLLCEIRDQGWSPADGEGSAGGGTLDRAEAQRTSDQ
jgi:voltage-gated potassium channel